MRGGWNEIAQIIGSEIKWYAKGKWKKCGEFRENIKKVCEKQLKKCYTVKHA